MHILKYKKLNKSNLKIQMSPIKFNSKIKSYLYKILKSKHQVKKIFKYKTKVKFWTKILKYKIIHILFKNLI